MKRPTIIRTTIGWCILCAIWMTYIVISGLVAFVRNGDVGGYGIFIDHRLLILVSAMPLELASTAALMDSGRKIALSIEAFGALAYSVIAIGLWRDSKVVRVGAACFFAMCTLLVVYYACFIIPTFWASWGASLGIFAAGMALVSLVINGGIAISFLRFRALWKRQIEMPR